MFEGIELRFHHMEMYFPTDYDKTRNIHDPCFTHQTTLKQGRCTHYFWYYDENPGIGCCFALPRNEKMGYHKHDLECVSIIFDNNEICPEPRFVYFHAHGYGQGVWKNWTDCEKNSKGQLVVYVARSSHASYPREGLYPRIFCLGNDATSAHGVSKIYTQFVPIPDQIKYSDGRIKKILDSLPVVSVSGWQRFFLPLTLPQIRKH